jgi:hypothetical protein
LPYRHSEPEDRRTDRQGINIREKLGELSAALSGLEIFLTMNPGRCPGLSSIGLSAFLNQRASAFISGERDFDTSPWPSFEAERVKLLCGSYVSRFTSASLRLGVTRSNCKNGSDAEPNLAETWLENDSDLGMSPKKEPAELLAANPAGFER